MEKSVIAQHARTHDHPVEWNDARIVYCASRHKELLVKEALHIQMIVKKGSLNKDGGAELHDVGWLQSGDVSRGVGMKGITSGGCLFAPLLWTVFYEHVMLCLINVNFLIDNNP